MTILYYSPSSVSLIRLDNCTEKFDASKFSQSQYILTKNKLFYYSEHKSLPQRIAYNGCDLVRMGRAIEVARIQQLPTHARYIVTDDGNLYFQSTKDITPQKILEDRQTIAEINNIDGIRYGFEHQCLSENNLNTIHQLIQKKQAGYLRPEFNTGPILELNDYFSSLNFGYENKKILSAAQLNTIYAKSADFRPDGVPDNGRLSQNQILCPTRGVENNIKNYLTTQSNQLYQKIDSFIATPISFEAFLQDPSKQLACVECYHSLHFAGCVIDKKSKTALYLDPLGNSNHPFINTLTQKGYQVIISQHRIQQDSTSCGYISAVLMKRLCDQYVEAGDNRPQDWLQSAINRTDFFADLGNGAKARLEFCYMTNTKANEYNDHLYFAGGSIYNAYLAPNSTFNAIMPADQYREINAFINFINFEIANSTSPQISNKAIDLYNKIKAHENVNAAASAQGRPPQIVLEHHQHDIVRIFLQKKAILTAYEAVKNKNTNPIVTFLNTYDSQHIYGHFTAGHPLLYPSPKPLGNALKNKYNDSKPHIIMRLLRVTWENTFPTVSAKHRAPWKILLYPLKLLAEYPICLVCNTLGHLKKTIKTKPDTQYRVLSKLLRTIGYYVLSGPHLLCRIPLVVIRLITEPIRSFRQAYSITSLLKYLSLMSSGLAYSAPALLAPSVKLRPSTKKIIEMTNKKTNKHAQIINEISPDSTDDDNTTAQLNHENLMQNNPAHHKEIEGLNANTRPYSNL